MIYFSDFDAAAPTSPYGNHAYWRVFATNNNGSGSFTSLAELAFKDGSGSTIPTTGGTVIFSSEVSSNEAAKAFDGDPASVWAGSGSTNQWIGYQFSSPVGVEQVALTSPTTNGGNQTPKDCLLQYSDDGSAWTTAFSFSNALYVLGSTITYPETLAAGYHRGFRINVTAVDGSSFLQLDELEFRATAGGADQTVPIGANYSTTDGRVLTNSDNGGNEAWRVFGNDSGTWFVLGTGAYVAFVFPAPVKVEEILMKASGSATQTPKDFTLDYTDDGATWTTQKTFPSQTGWTGGQSRVLAAI